MLDAGAVGLVDLYSPVDRYCLFASLMYPTSLQQMFTGTRPSTPESYQQDLGEFLVIWRERRKWLKANSTAILEYMAVPGDAVSPNRFCLVVSFQYENDAAKYRRQFCP